MTPENTTFAQKLAAKKAQEELARRAAVKEVYDEDLIPEDPYSKSEDDLNIDRVISGIGILEAYAKYCGKSKPRVAAGQTESIKVSCPVPGHTDNNPSAWVNTDTNLWHCAVCNKGGDVLELAAMLKGYPTPGYKTGQLFHKLREDVATDFGFVITKLPSGAVAVSSPEPAASTPPRAPAPPANPSKSDNPPVIGVAAPEPTAEAISATEANVVELFDDEDDSTILPSFEWEKIVPADTFLGVYMKQTTVDDIPEEFHLFHAILALGFALGRDVKLFDKMPVYGNLFLCTIGRSGSGKSIARSYLDELLSQALPHNWDDPNSKGVHKVQSPGSAEVLIHNFQKPVKDLSDPAAPVLWNAPVRGIIDFNELSALTGRAARTGNTLKPTMMQFYDMERTISTSSMSTGRKEAAEPFASAVTSVQPRALKDLVNNSDDASGFLNRWMFISGKDKKRFAIGGVIVDITPAIKPLQEIIAWASTFRGGEMVQWSTEAAQRFTEFFHGRVQIDKKKSQTDLIVRLDLLLKKLILLLAANRMEKEVSLQTVEEVIFMYDYLIACYAIPAAEIGNTLASEIQGQILKVAQKRYEKDKAGVTVREIMRALARHKYPLDLVERTIRSLCALDMLHQEIVKPATGRPTERYKYVV